MKKQTVITTILASGFLFASTVSFAQNNDTDLVYGSSSVAVSVSEPFLFEASVPNNIATDLVYGDFQIEPTSRGETHDHLVDNRNNSTDLIYGS